MRQVFSVMMILIAFGPRAPEVCAQGDLVGLFFDPELTTNCMPTSTYPITVDLYLVLADCQSLGGVGAWECSVEFPEGSYVIATDFLREAINFRSPPEYVVGLGNPIISASVIQLAKFTALFTQPGGVIVHGCANPSLANAAGLVYADGSNLDRLVPTGYQYGSPLTPIAVIGDTIPCPEPGQAEPAIFDRAIPGQPIPLAATTEFKVIGSADVVGTSAAKSMSVGDWYENSDLAVTGVVTDLESLCVEDPHYRRAGIGRITVAVDSLYWGPPLSTLDVFAKGVFIGGCMAYSPSRSFAVFDSIVIGSRVSLAAYYEEQRFWTRDEMFAVLDAKSTAINREVVKDLDHGRATAGIGSLYMQSDIVAEVEFAANKEVRVVRLLKSSVPLQVGDVLELTPASVSRVQRMAANGDGRVVCFLRQIDGGYQLTSWRHGALSRRDGEFFDRSGLPISWLWSVPRSR